MNDAMGVRVGEACERRRQHDALALRVHLRIGGREEAELADSLMKAVARPERIASAVHIIALQDLPRLLAACDLFIGNNSGPKHLAAAIGLPTIGIHSGVVDPVEWGPLGSRAVALQRKMECSPCYLDRVEDCPRDLRCLRTLEPSSVYRMAELFLAQPQVAPNLVV
jgi:ADP-heptose:LPS heptosyltransferase